ncbi:MAG: hypothetical protein PHI98_01660 [Eubacteriales bacterium]|nr:hypothetical protein [Eubacteriales bacterium]
MLLADVNGEEIHRVKRYREGLRTFAALDKAGNIEPEMIRLAAEKVGEFSREAYDSGAKTVYLFATSAVRDAKNQTTFTKAIEQATGLCLEICSGDLEAKLSYIGATGSEPSGMIDIGGGSTEIAIGANREISYAHSLQMGAVRLYRIHPIMDSASADEVVALATTILQPLRDELPALDALQWVGVGGTFTTIAALAQQIPWDDRKRIHHYLLSVEAVENTLYSLAPMSMEQRLRLPSLQPQRADIVVHGVAILLACMRFLRIDALRVSEYGNLEGYLKTKYLQNVLK